MQIASYYRRQGFGFIKVKKHRRRLGRRSQRKKGGSYWDYIPGYSYYKSASDTLQEAKDVIKTAKDVNKTVKEINKQIYAPLTPPPPLPVYNKSFYDDKYVQQSKKDIAYNNKLKELRALGKIKPEPAPQISFFGALRGIKPISFIDRSLEALGQRDNVRNYLNQNIIGKTLVQSADNLIKAGYGLRRKRQHRYR